MDVLQGVQEGVGRRREGRGSGENESLPLAKYVYTYGVGNPLSAFLWISYIFWKIWDGEWQPLLLVRAL